MHAVVQNGLEEYLSGSARRDFQAHLDSCAECRREVAEFSGLSGLLGALRVTANIEEALEPAPGFYYRLTQTLETERSARSPWSVFSIGAAFGRRVAFASLMMLAVVGSLLISHESSFGLASDEREPITKIMASHDSTAPRNSVENRDRMMLTLATYNH
jgi:anti-sigma factor RsiW